MQNDETTWGREPQQDYRIEEKTKLRYIKFLKITSWILIALVIVLSLGLLIGTSIFIISGDFERTIFDDGTELVCIFNPETGVISQNE